LIEPEVLRSYPVVGFQINSDETAIVPPPARPDRGDPSFSELRQRTDPVPDELDQMTQHPPLAYLLHAGWYRALQLDDLPVRSALFWLRALDCLLAASVPIWAFLVVRELGGSIRAGAAAGALTLLVPQGIHVGSTVNNGNVLLPLVGGFLVAICRAARSEARAALMVAAALAGLASFTKLFGLACLPAIALAIYLRRRASRRQVVVDLVATGAVFIAAGGWWWLLNLLRYGKVQPLGDNVDAEARHGLVHGVIDITRHFVDSSFFNPGYLEKPLPLVLSTGLCFLTVVATAFSVAVGLRRAPRPTLLLAVTVVFIVLVAVAPSLALYVDRGAVRAAQSRYLLPGLPALAGLLAWRWQGRWTAALPVAGLVAVAAAAKRGADVLWAGTGARPRVTALAWSPVSGGGLVLLALVAMVSAAAVSALMLSRDAPAPPG
jgi:hypothetical protein